MAFDQQVKYRRDMSDDNANASRSEALQRAWTFDAKATRPGPRRTFSTDAIVEAGIRLYDTDGHQGFSLARLAAALNLTTNALYRYVASRDELEALIRDAALGQPTLQLNGNWQDDVRSWARALALRYSQHPWLAHLPVRIPFTPNALAWLEALLLALRAAGLDRPTQLSAAALLDSHVRASAVAAVDQTESRGLTLPENFHALLINRGLLTVADVVGHGQYVEVAADGLEMLDFGLETFLQGIAARVV